MRPSIDSIRGLGEYQRVYDWGVSFTGSAPAWAKEAGFGSHAMTSLNLLHALSVKLPTRNNESITIKLKATRVRQRGIQEYGGIVSVTFAETESGFVRRIFNAWAKAQLDWETQNKGMPAHSGDGGCAVDLRLTQYSRDSQITASYLLSRCVLKNENFGELSGQNEIQKITVDIDVSLITPEVSDSYISGTRFGGTNFAGDIRSAIGGIFT